MGGLLVHPVSLRDKTLDICFWILMKSYDLFMIFFPTPVCLYSDQKSISEALSDCQKLCATGSFTSFIAQCLQECF